MPYKNKEDRLACQRRHYAKHKEEVIKKVAERKKQQKAEWVEFKKTLKCAKCGFNHHAALDFHHKNPEEKDREVSYYVRNCLFAKAKNEIIKINLNLLTNIILPKIEIQKII